MEPRSPALQVDSLSSETPGKPLPVYMENCNEYTQQNTQHIYKEKQTTGTCDNINDCHKCYTVPKMSPSKEYILCDSIYMKFNRQN